VLFHKYIYKDFSNASQKIKIKYFSSLSIQTEWSESRLKKKSSPRKRNIFNNDKCIFLRRQEEIIAKQLKSIKNTKKKEKRKK